jgi:hypothetical protein
MQLRYGASRSKWQADVVHPVVLLSQGYRQAKALKNTGK